MPRIARLLRTGERTAYHVMSHTALNGYPLGDVEKRLSGQSFQTTRPLVFCGNYRLLCYEYAFSPVGKNAGLSEFVKEIKMGLSRFYNRRHDRRGFFWGDRFKSVIAEKGETLIKCLAYIDLNPVRAGLVKEPEDYRWNSIGHHVRTNNKDKFSLQKNSIIQS